MKSVKLILHWYLAGELDTRLSEETKLKPKPMVELVKNQLSGTS